MTSHWDSLREEVWAIAERLGLNRCRRFTRWYDIQPAPGMFRLDALEAELELAAKHGVREWLCIVEPPAFAFPGKVKRTSYNAFECRWDDWERMVRTVTMRLKGKFIGWEWLNEITPEDARTLWEHT